MNAVKRSPDCAADFGSGVAKAGSQLPKLPECGEDVMEDQAAAEEVERLQRQYRILENQRKSYYEKSQFLLLKQRKEIEMLEKEKAELQLNMKLAQVERSKIRSKCKQQISQLLQRQKDYLQAIESEKATCKILDQQIMQTEFDLEKQRKKLQNDVPLAANQKKIEILENRIAYATVQYNKLLAKNSALRGEIDGLLKERERFHALYQCLSRSLLRGKKEILALIEEAKAAYDQREEVQTKLQALRRRDEGEQAQYTSDIRNLRRTVAHEEKLQDFLVEKWKDRSGGNGKDRDVSVDPKSPVALTQVSKKYLAAFREVFDRLKQHHGEENLEKLVESFVQREEKNYALFAYVHDVTQDGERLQKEIEESRSKISQLKDVEKKRNVGYQQKLTDLQKNLEDAKQESIQMETATKTEGETLKKLKKGILGLLKWAQVPEESLKGIVQQESEGLSEDGAVNLMALLEERATDIAFAFSQLKDREDKEEEEEGDGHREVRSAKQEEDKKGYDYGEGGADLLLGAAVSGESETDNVSKSSDLQPQQQQLQQQRADERQRRARQA